ncbi:MULTISPECIES: RES domain-containing protein [unclassified Microbacterium]|uniref:RES domain-containing protein n=1 Tax=unclassified Microbacterium TaxID=2609290 RepID=UPI001444727E|nr:MULTISPECIES: RES domain-containing protein [unclassified Microbacterium]
MGFHVGKLKYRQPSAAVRTADNHRQDWGRFDVIGETFYVAENVETAYAEVLAGFKLPNGVNDSLEEIADMLGVDRAEAVAWIAEDWALIEPDFQGVGAIPASWRKSRRVFEVEMSEPGWLVDVHHPASISAIEAAGGGAMANWLARQGIPALTLSALTSENRMVTTTIADVIRTATLEDGSSPRGIQFPSKHGGGWCRALWLPEGTPPPLGGVSIASENQIEASSEPLKVVADRFHITIT